MDDSENGGRDAGTVAYDLRKEKRIRGGQRGATTRLLNRGAELLAGDVVDAVEVEHVKTSLQGKVTVLKALDEAILNGMGEDEDIEREIDDADRLQCDVLLCIAKLKAAVVQSNVEESQSAAVPVPVVLSPVLAAAPTASSSSHSVTRATNESLAEDSTHQSVSTPEGYSTPQLEVQLQLTGDRNESKAVSGTRLADPLESQANPDSAQVPREPIDECTIHAIREGLSEAHEKAGSPGIMVPFAPMTRSMSVASNHEEAMSYNLRLPKLKLRSYDGNLAEWTTFWDMFTTSVHNNPKIATIDKFSYLKSVLEGPAARAVETLTTSAANYARAVEKLTHRFGNKQLLINRHMDILSNLRPVKECHDLSGLRHMYDEIEGQIGSLRALGVSPDSYGSLLSSNLMAKLPEELTLAVSRDVKGDEWHLDKLMEVFSGELEARERAAHAAGTGRASATRTTTPKRTLPTAAALPATAQPTCSYCNKGHGSASCTVVTDVSARRAILRKSGRCYVCLRKGHMVRDCRSQSRCHRCQRRHHSSICEAGTATATTAQAEPGSSSVNFVCSVTAEEPVLLQTALVTAANPNSDDTSRLRLLFDTGSQLSFITEKAAQAMNLTASGTTAASICSFGGSEDIDHHISTVQVNLRTDNGSVVPISLLVRPKITMPLQNQDVKAQCNVPHLRHLKLADPLADGRALEVDVLIGLDNYWTLVTSEVRQGDTGPTAVNTLFGWMLSGPSDQCSSAQCNQVVVHLVNASLQQEKKIKPSADTDVNLSSQLQEFWNIESLGIQERSVHDEFLDTVKFNGERYEVSLPWRQTHEVLPDNYDLSLRRFHSQFKKLKKNPQLLNEYDAIITDQLAKGVIEEVKDAGCVQLGRVHYLPHHAVVRRDKDTTKVRVVYDASAKSIGPSLNECLHAGPPMTEKILDILLRFRASPVALSADIEKAFLMINIKEEDRDVLRFFWVRNTSQETPEIVVYRFTRVVFGVASSPFLLNATLKVHIEQRAAGDASFVRDLLRALYVDDMNGGEKDADSALVYFMKARRHLAHGGFNLRKMVTNSADLRKRVADIDPAILKPEQEDNVEHRVLGVRWNYVNDTLDIDLDEAARTGRSKGQVTKRKVVQTSASCFDPLGLLSPAILRMKIFFQQLCKNGHDWDEPLPETRVAEWNAITGDLQNCKVSVPRCYHPDPAATWSLHGFCDASTKAYAAVVYLVKRNGDGIHTRFVAAKTRVAPLKEVSIPRLELLAAVILARLITTVRLALEGQLKIDDMVCWSDSLVALYWITNPGHKEWKQFVSNRVNGIHGLVPGMKWRYCPTDQNPADVASRGTSCMNLMADERWLNGPTAFLAEWSNSDCPDNSVEDPPAICLEEEKSKKKEQQPKPVTVSAATVNSPAEDIGNVIDSNVFGTYTRLIRVTATMLLAVDRMKKRSDSKTPMTAHLRRAEELWILAAQKSIKSDAKLTKTVKQLDVREEESGVLRCGGRLQNALISEGAKYPILLPTEHHVTNLIIMDCHQRMMHGGSKATLADVREKFWIVRGRQVVKKLIGRCVICRRHKGKPLRGPLAPPLPPFRIQQAPAFQNIGLDNAGPLFVNGSEKVWILLFTCCVTRAIHLELVESLSTDAFLRAMRRFTARRGVPSFIVSDNAQTFKAASKFLNRVGQQTIQWSFNLPRAPWWGGVFERLIRSVKRCLRKVVGGARLTRDELNTVITEVEMVINARPLGYVGMTSDDMEPPLTPSHLLHGRRISQMAEEPVVGGSADNAGRISSRIWHFQRLSRAEGAESRAECGRLWQGEQTCRSTCVHAHVL